MKWPKGFHKTLPYLDVKIRARVIDGKQKIEMVTAPSDAFSGKIADAARCMDANCVMRYANAGLLPRKVYASWFYKSMAYLLISQSKGKFVVERFLHRDWPAIQLFDRSGKMSPAERAKKFSGRKVILCPVNKSKTIGQDRTGYKGGANRHTQNMGGKPTGRVATPREAGMNARFLTLKQWQETSQGADA